MSKVFVVFGAAAMLTFGGRLIAQNEPAAPSIAEAVEFVAANLGGERTFHFRDRPDHTEFTRWTIVSSADRSFVFEESWSFVNNAGTGGILNQYQVPLNNLSTEVRVGGNKGYPAITIRCADGSPCIGHRSRSDDTDWSELEGVNQLTFGLLDDDLVPRVLRATSAAIVRAGGKRPAF